MRCLYVFITVFAVVNAGVIKAPSAAGDQIRYDNCTVYKVHLRDRKQVATLNHIKGLLDHFDIWKEYDDVSKEVHIMVKPEGRDIFERFTRFYDFGVELMIPDVQQLIDEETQANSLARDANTFGWTSYHTLTEIEEWLDGVLSSYPEVTTGFTVGQSYEGRTIRGIKISYKSGNPGIFIESNIHAREWITSATATWFINELLTSESDDVRNIAENYDWYIVPVFNVDGFSYSHEKNRLWRKTRQPVSTSDCIGTDANRNFEFQWMASGGASSDPCSETYAGAEPYSEPETLALTEYLKSIKDQISMYISFHSYGQYLLSPYGHSETEFPENYDDILEIGSEFANAISSLSYGTQYTFGSTAEVLYIASGLSIDWVYNDLDIKISYTIEFRDKGRYGFVLPPVQILPNCEELRAGMLALIDKTKELGYL